ncbi:MAG TPA: hypothetical protein VIT67_06830 [Povalibacter sp.]
MSELFQPSVPAPGFATHSMSVFGERRSQYVDNDWLGLEWNELPRQVDWRAGCPHVLAEERAQAWRLEQGMFVH